MNLNKLKKSAAFAVLKYISLISVIGIGTGSTIKHLIKLLPNLKLKGVISSSSSSSFLLKKYKISELYLNDVLYLFLYIDGADEINMSLYMIKGGGAALTKEKIIATKAIKFICIIDEFKMVDTLGSFPLPVEIIPMAYKFVKFELQKLGYLTKLRKNFITENGNIILDIYNLSIKKPNLIEKKINSIPGVVTVGLFTYRKADLVFIGTMYGIKIIKDI
ncbi:ribose-5-phosphate isomerase RpiA [Buchnera aphidicola (Mollitrichosiphum nigrofasciatum)]|uniref:ribose-5-phosphate isomerase RpiA n=1 Tax=Buchnera aphidicola TaxID=9 RepID=UPI0031B8B0E0